MIELVITGNPGDLSINTRDRGKVAIGRHSQRYRSAMTRATHEINRQIANTPDTAWGREPMRGALHIHSFWPCASRIHSRAGLVVAYGDVDAPVKSCFDLLTKCGVWVDDMCCMRFSAEKSHDRENPRIVLTLTEWS